MSAWDGADKLAQVLADLEGKRAGEGHQVNASKIKAIVSIAIKRAKFFKFIVHDVERFIRKGSYPTRIRGLFIIDAICKVSKERSGSSDVYCPRFEKSLVETMRYICHKQPEIKYVKKVVDSWARVRLFSTDVLVSLGQILMKEYNIPLEAPLFTNAPDTSDSPKMNQDVSRLLEQAEGKNEPPAAAEEPIVSLVGSGGGIVNLSMPDFDYSDDEDDMAIDANRAREAKQRLAEDEARANAPEQPFAANPGIAATGSVGVGSAGGSYIGQSAPSSSSAASSQYLGSAPSAAAAAQPPLPNAPVPPPPHAPSAYRDFPSRPAAYGNPPVPHQHSGEYRRESAYGSGSGRGPAPPSVDGRRGGPLGGHAEAHRSHPAHDSNVHQNTSSGSVHRSPAMHPDRLRQLGGAPAAAAPRTAPPQQPPARQAPAPVVPAGPPAQRFGGAPRMSTTLCVMNITQGIGEEHIQPIFSAFGSVERVHMMLKNPVAPVAFVDFHDRPSAEAAKAGLDGQEFFGRSWRIRWAPGKGRREGFDQENGIWPGTVASPAAVAPPSASLQPEGGDMDAAVAAAAARVRSMRGGQ